MLDDAVTERGELERELVKRPSPRGRQLSASASAAVFLLLFDPGCMRFGYELIEQTSEDTCRDLANSGDATDCGNETCPGCTTPQACGKDSDCESGVCEAQECVEPSCDDEVQNGDESDLDCGGDCLGCDDDDDCNSGADCESGVCESGACQAPNCSDGIKNAAETASDCGGGDCPACDNGRNCDVDSDCTSQTCWFCINTPWWTDAQVDCQSVGMDLVRVDDPDENDWLTATSDGYGMFAVGEGGSGLVLIGGNDIDVNGEWRWPDGEQFWSGGSQGSAVGGLYTNWASTQPASGGVANCSGILSDGIWQSRTCTDPQPFICESG